MANGPDAVRTRQSREKRQGRLLSGGKPEGMASWEETFEEERLQAAVWFKGYRRR